MTRALRAPFFEIGPKNLLRLGDLQPIVMAAAEAGDEHEVSVVLTVPTAYLAPIVALGTSALVFAQGMDEEVLGDSMARVTAEALADVGASGVMLNHDSNPLTDDALARALDRAHALGLQTIACADDEEQALRFAKLEPTAVLFEPPGLIGTVGTGERAWVGSSTIAIHDAAPTVLAMHAGGVASASIAESIMAAGADGTGSTSGVLFASDPAAAAHGFIAATRVGWDRATRA